MIGIWSESKEIAARPGVSEDYKWVDMFNECPMIVFEDTVTWRPMWNMDRLTWMGKMMEGEATYKSKRVFFF